MSNYVESLGQFWGPLLVLGQIALFTLVLLLSIAFLLLLDRKVCLLYTSPSPRD